MSVGNFLNFNGRVFILPLFLFFYNFILAQDSIKNNYSDLSRFTFGVHNTNYKNGFYVTDDPRNTSFIESNSAKSVFFDFRFVDYKNHALRFGLFLNSFNHYLKYRGESFDIILEEYREFDGKPYRDVATHKERAVELYINYSYLLKIKNNFYFEPFAGISYEHNTSIDDLYEVEHYFSTGPPDWIPYQQNFYSSYLTESDFFRSHFGASVAYKADIGMFNLGFKYSIPFKNMLFGNSYFYDPGPNGENHEYFNYYSVSGKYMSFTLSFTPAKGLFRGKK